MYISQVSLESNNYSQAVEDLSKAVSIKVKTAPAGSRLVISHRILLTSCSL